MPSLAGILKGCTEKKPPLWAPLNLTKRQRDILRAVSDRIIPATDTPGAVDAGVPDFIEILLKDVFPRAEARAFLSDLENLDTGCKALTGQVFTAASSVQQDDWLRKVSEDGHSFHAFFRKIHGLVVTTYFTSEKGMKEALNYVPIPEKFKGCIPAEKNVKLMVGNRL
jgi:hypothetical protein